MAALPTVSVGDVFFLRCTHCNPPKMKFFVAAQVLPLRMLLINSEPNEFQRASPSHLAAMAKVSAASHSFLTHDSVVACDHLSHEFSIDQLQGMLVNRPDILVGHLHADAIDAVRRALVGNEHIARKYLRDLYLAWGC